MKKIVVSAFVVAALLVTACKSEKKEGTDALNEVKSEVKKTSDMLETEAEKATEMIKTETEEATEKATEMVQSETEKASDKMEEAQGMIKSALDGIEIPKFENEVVTKHLESYASYAKEYIASKGDMLKNAKLAKEGVALATKGKELLGSLDAESAQKFKNVMSAIQSKMAPAK